MVQRDSGGTGSFDVEEDDDRYAWTAEYDLLDLKSQVVSEITNTINSFTGLVLTQVTLAAIVASIKNSLRGLDYIEHFTIEQDPHEPYGIKLRFKILRQDQYYTLSITLDNLR